VWAKFLQFRVGIGVDFKNADDRIYHFERIDTEEFFPDDEAIRKGIAKPGGAPVSVGPVSLRIALESAEPPAQDIAL